jgi:hypothetical protein
MLALSTYGCGHDKPPTAETTASPCGNPVSEEQAKPIATKEALRLLREKYHFERTATAYPTRKNDMWVVTVELSGMDSGATVRIDSCSGAIVSSELSGAN